MKSWMRALGSAGCGVCLAAEISEAHSPGNVGWDGNWDWELELGLGLGLGRSCLCWDFTPHTHGGNQGQGT